MCFFKGMNWVMPLPPSNIRKGVEEVIHTSDQIDQVFHISIQIPIKGVKMCSHIRSCLLYTSDAADE